jgi:AAA family ATP:ADP antiporter
VLIAGLILISLFYALNRILGKSRMADPSSHPHIEENEVKGFSLRESFQYVRKSKHLSYLMIVVFGYYMVYNLADIIWTDQVGLRFKGDTAALNEYLNQVSTIKGLVATFLAVVVSGKVIERFGWYPAALITPALLAITSLLFFVCIFFDQGFLGDVVISLFASPFIHIVVLIGAIQHCLVRASKYTVFDATKEMAFIPLSRHSQRMGKAVIDGVGARIGKSGGSFVFQFLLYFLGSLSATVPYIAVLTGVILVAWIYAVGKLKKEIEKKVNETV